MLYQCAAAYLYLLKGGRRSDIPIFQNIPRNSAIFPHFYGALVHLDWDKVPFYDATLQSTCAFYLQSLHSAWDGTVKFPRYFREILFRWNVPPDRSICQLGEVKLSLTSRRLLAVLVERLLMERFLF